MPILLVGEVVNSADATTGFSVGNISGDDDFVEGAGAIGVKASATTTEMYTTSLGATAPYDFSSGGGEFGYHIIMWFNSKTPLQTVNSAGMRITVGNGTDRGHWNVYPTGFYKGGFVTAAVNSARDFDTIAAGTWTTTGNPAQLSNITEMGGVFETVTSIMGSFNNVQLDQFTIGFGIRCEGATYNFEDIRAEDEDTNFWGWWSSKNGQIVGKGKLYIGPVTGTLSTTFTSLAESVVFADERVAEGFYEIQMVGNNTNVDFTLISISAATGSARWSLNASSSLNTFSDTNGVWKGADQILLNSGSHLTGTTFVDCNKLFQSGSTMDGCSILDANTVAGEAFIISDQLANIQNSSFEYAAGHAIEIPPNVSTPVTYSFVGNTFVGYTADDTSGSAIFNNSGGPILINITDGDSPTVRNSFGSSTDVQNPVVLTLTGLISGSEVRILSSSQTPPQELAGTEESSTTFTYNYTFTSGLFIDIVVLNLTHKYLKISNLELGSSNTSIPIQQETDRVYLNP